MRGILPLVLFIILLASGAALLALQDENKSNPQPPGQPGVEQCYLVVYTIVDDASNYGKITGVSTTTTRPGEQLAASPDPGEPYIHVVVSRNAVLLEDDVQVGGGYTESYINVTTLKGATVDVKIQLYDPDPGQYGIPEHRLLDQYNATLTLCG